jgi:MerR family transcriptional regulator, light-induced transcriptional regulator
MSNAKFPKSTLPDALMAAEPSRHRIGAVAKMVSMPVTTLRVWERRYRLCQPALTPTGQRLYSDDDVRRLTLIKQLTDKGHAIGTLAGLDIAQLLQVATTHAQAQGAIQDGNPHFGPALNEEKASTQPWRLVLIGAPLGVRLQRPALLRRLNRRVVLLGPFDDVGQASAALQGSPVDACLVHQPQLHEDGLRSLKDATSAFMGVPMAILFRYGTDTACESLANEGFFLLREPQTDAVIAQWLNSWLHPQKRMSSSDAASAPRQVASISPPRWDDAELASFANLSPTMACECPRHVAELLMQLAHFEAYSAACENRHDEDGLMHAHLRQVTTESRLRFEDALAMLAQHEGLQLSR